MSKPSFAYTIYIHATAERVWQGLIDPEFTRVYWMHEFVTDWQVGSKWEQQSAKGTVPVGGEVVEYDEPRRLVLSWVPPADAGNAEKTSLVALEIEPQDWPGGPWVSLRVTHSELEPESEMLTSISWGWPALMSGLKTLLESPHLLGVEPQDMTADDDE